MSSPYYPDNTVHNCLAVLNMFKKYIKLNLINSKLRKNISN